MQARHPSAEREDQGVWGPANFVLVDDAGWQLYYSHWAANQICSALIAGPEAATRFITAQRRCAEDAWLSDVFAHGSVLVDHRVQRLIFFGDGLMMEMPTRRALVGLPALTWPGGMSDGRTTVSAT
ncbi:hypothetical protein NE236_30285 [Actinoallomurus purpureus]|uniref:hypothetical protein n=1 Tax=Actinoallomurus purpureus TaxID=478114 RepID=UPI002092EBEF|nr:hypothetical protein [Actinoallomurus purpureus]MCO6009268.1 hypothetical protein [Actinoallomurus purpureus]